MENVPPGLVRLEVSSIGYQTLVTVGFLLGTAGERTENIGLEPASTLSLIHISLVNMLL